MNKLKHTPGPWRFKREIVYDNGYPVYEKYYLSIGDRLLFIDSNGSPGENEQSANARLIAAAPEMRDALIEDIKDDLANISCGFPACECAYNKKDYLECDTLKKIKIIEKATGQKIEEVI